MKKLTYISALLLTLILSTSCDDEFLERIPETAIGKENFFNSEEDLAIYINNLYDFPGLDMYIADRGTDNQAFTGEVEMKTIMTTNASSVNITGGWDWTRLRTINFFLDNVDKADISDEARNHFEGLARFFRARFYMNMVARYSDVPWYDKPLETDDEEQLFKGRDSREMVVDKIFEDYQFAANHVYESQPVGAVNKWVVKTYMARHALYEGTFRKYHDELALQGSADRFIQIARDVAKEIMDSGAYSIYNTGDPMSDYGSLFTSTNLGGNPEIILANISVDNLKNSGNWALMFGNYEACPSRDMLQAYLMQDGSFYTTQEGYETKLFVEEFENRDNRLFQTYAYPGWILYNTQTYAQGGGVYVQQLNKNFSGYHQIKGFANTTDVTQINEIDYPVLRYAEVLLIYAEAQAELGQLTQADLDMTINILRERAGVAPMNLGTEVDPVQQSRYPNITSAQAAELLEIRRERRVELAFEGHRMSDIMRWKAGKLLEQEPEGLYFPSLGKYDLTGDGVEDIELIDLSQEIPTAESKENNSLGVPLIYYRTGPQDSDANVYLSNSTSGVVQTIKERGTFINPKHYYRPVPQTHVTVNPNLTQIFGWE